MQPDLVIMNSAGAPDSKLKLASATGLRIRLLG